MAGSLPVFLKTWFMKLFCFIGFMIAVITGNAQLKGFSIGPFAEMGFPTGSFKETNKNGYGAGFGADIRLGKLGFTGSLGYMQFGGKTIQKENGLVEMPALKAVPIRAGIKYRLIPALYAKLEGGVAKFSGGDESAFIFSPGIGIRVLGIDVQAKYEVWKAEQSYSFMGLKAGINF
jgi:hypothetical protein